MNLHQTLTSPLAALIAVGTILLVTPDAWAVRHTCPLSTAVAPFGLLEIGFYGVRITDGGPGDTDGTADGTCEFRVRFCLGDSSSRPEACLAEPVKSFAVRAKWGPTPDLRTAVTDDLMSAVASLGGAIDGLQLVTFDPPQELAGACVERTIRLPAAAHSDLSGKLLLRSKLRVGGDTLPPTRRAKVILECAPAPTDPTVSVAPVCRAGRTTCDAAGSPPQPTPIPPPTGSGRTFYISPNGSNSNTGLSVDSPWRTFGKVFNSSKILQPGDVLVLLDGTYTPTTTGLISVDCSAAGNARNGTLGFPITIQALNQRRAFLKSTGVNPVEITNCSYWNIVGLYAKNADNLTTESYRGDVFRIQDSSHLVLRRLLAVHPNMNCSFSVVKDCNAHGIAVSASQDVLVEECEVYDYHRHAFSLHRSVDSTVRRSYSNDRGTGGQTSTIAYSSSRCRFENNIGEGPGRFTVNGSGTAADGSVGGRDNAVLGSILLGVSDNQGAVVKAREFAPRGDNRAPKNNRFKDVVIANSLFQGVYSRGAYNTVLENVTLLGNATGSGAAFSADDEDALLFCSEIVDGCSFRITNSLILDGGGDGVGVEQPALGSNWLVEYANIYGSAGASYPTSESISDGSGHIQFSLSVAPTGGVGLGTGQCLLWMPDSSNMKGAGRNGADIGATILYRYENGTLTDHPLWDPVTGAFPCGAIVSGVNDLAGRSCFDLHQRLNVNANGCRFPTNYP